MKKITNIKVQKKPASQLFLGTKDSKEKYEIKQTVNTLAP